MSSSPSSKLVSGSKILLREEQDSNARTKEGFDPNAYKLMEKAAYDFNNPFLLGKVVELETYSLNKIQKRVKNNEA